MRPSPSMRRTPSVAVSRIVSSSWMRSRRPSSGATGAALAPASAGGARRRRGPGTASSPCFPTMAPHGAGPRPPRAPSVAAERIEPAGFGGRHDGRGGDRRGRSQRRPRRRERRRGRRRRGDRGAPGWRRACGRRDRRRRRPATGRGSPCPGRSAPGPRRPSRPHRPAAASTTRAPSASAMRRKASSSLPESRRGRMRVGGAEIWTTLERAGSAAARVAVASVRRVVPRAARAWRSTARPSTRLAGDVVEVIADVGCRRAEASRTRNCGRRSRARAATARPGRGRRSGAAVVELRSRRSRGSRERCGRGRIPGSPSRSIATAPPSRPPATRR